MSWSFLILFYPFPGIFISLHRSKFPSGIMYMFFLSEEVSLTFFIVQVCWQWRSEEVLKYIYFAYFFHPPPTPAPMGYRTLVWQLFFSEYFKDVAPWAIHPPSCWTMIWLSHTPAQPFNGPHHRQLWTTKFF